MKRAFATRKGNTALCFMFEKQRLLLHIRQRRMLHSKLPPRVLKNNESCDIMKSERRWKYEKGNYIIY